MDSLFPLFLSALYVLYAVLAPLFDFVHLQARYIVVLLILAVVYWVVGLVGTSKRLRIGLTLLAGPILTGRYLYTPPMSKFDSVPEYWPALLGVFRSVLAEAPTVIGLGVASMATGATLCAMEVRKHRRAKEPSEDAATGNTDRAPQALNGTEAPGHRQNTGAISQ